MRERRNKKRRIRGSGVGRKGIGGQKESRGIKIRVTMEEKTDKKITIRLRVILKKNIKILVFHLEGVRIQQIRKLTHVLSELITQICSVR
jgi:hypothetical protein